MKVLLSTPPPDRLGGVSNFYVDLRDHLDKDIVYFHVGRRAGESRALTIFRLLVDYFRFIWVLFREHFDIVHLNPSLGPKAVWRDALFVLIARIFGKDTIVFMHGWNKDYEEKLRHCGLRLFRKAYFHAHAFIVLAKEFETSLRAMGYRGAIYMMTTTFDNTLLLQARSHMKRTVSGEPFNILFLSRVEWQKGIFEALAAFAIVHETSPHVYMTVAGSGAALEEAQEYVRDKSISNVKFLGYVRGESKAETFATADCYLFPSYYGEGMPITVVEAMAFGLPIIARRVGGLADFFEDGEMGFLTESKDPAVFAELLKRLMDAPDLCDQMSRTNREYAMRHFSAAGVADRLVSVYRDVATGKSSGYSLTEK